MKNVPSELSGKKIFRVRGKYARTGKQLWLTTVWRRTRDEAEWDKKYYGESPEGRWIDLRIVEMDVGDYCNAHKRAPRFS